LKAARFFFPKGFLEMIDPNDTPEIQTPEPPQSGQQPANTPAAPQSDNDQQLPNGQTTAAGAVVSNAAQQPQQQPSSASPSQPSLADHPAVQKASILHTVAQTLAGGPRYKTVIDPTTGATTRQPVPLSKADIGMAIAMSAISGALAGLSQKGPGATGAAGAAGFQQVAQQRQQADQAQQAQAQEDANNKASALARAAQLFETNSRTILNTSEAEQQGVDVLQKLIGINRESGVLDVPAEALDNSGQPMTQDELMDAMKTGKLSSTDHLGPIAGMVEVSNPDGSKRVEATHLVIKDPSTPVDLTQAMWDRYAAAGVRGFSPGVKIGTTPVKLSMIQSANEALASHTLANQRLSDLRDTLDGTPLANKVPTRIDFATPGVETALKRFQKYVSHNAANLEDPYAALQQMGADRRDPKTGEMQPNPDAKYVDTVAQSFGGWNLLSAAHNQIAANRKLADEYAIIDSDSKANAVLASPKHFSPDQIQAARNFVSLANQQGSRKAAEEARARAVAEGRDVESMMKTGINPITRERLTLDNAPDSMLVDTQGRVVPQNEVSLFKPTAQQRQTADTARQVLAISAGLQAAVQQNPNLIGPLTGRSKQGLAKAGLGEAESQKLLDDLSFLQSAATKMHTGRFSNQILKKMGDLIKPGMNPDQFSGALNSINDVAGRYAKEDQLVTVGDLKQMQNGVQRVANRLSNPAPTPRVVPAGATPGRDASGNIIGYRTPDGTVVRF
jgi:hypothetical protein